jgi:hypothetical protein
MLSVLSYYLFESTKMLSVLSYCLFESTKMLSVLRYFPVFFICYSDVLYISIIIFLTSNVYVVFYEISDSNATDTSDVCSTSD